MSVCRLRFDPAFEPAAWIANEGASAPSLVPTWPESQFVALVVVLRQNKVGDPEGDTAAFIVGTRDDMHEIARYRTTPQLWFTIAWKVVEPYLPRKYSAKGKKNDAIKWLGHDRQEGHGMKPG
jgi:hypothetical protein